MYIKNIINKYFGVSKIVLVLATWTKLCSKRNLAMQAKFKNRQQN